MSKNITIPSALDLETGKEVFASDLFRNGNESEIHKLRMKTRENYHDTGNPSRFRCYGCGKPISIVGRPKAHGNGSTVYFRHFHERGKDCPIGDPDGERKSKEQIERIKYNGAKESPLHIKLKEFVFNKLVKNKSITGLAMEKVTSDAISKEWKKPDVSAKFIDKNIVFELQLSTTFLDVIAKRNVFYKRNEKYIFWIFHEFDLRSDKQKFTQKDIIYPNNRNAFVLNENAMSESIRRNELVLRCYYQAPRIKNNEIIFDWKMDFVTLNQITFDESNYKIYYFDSDGEEQRLKTEIEGYEKKSAKERIEVFRKETQVKSEKNIEICSFIAEGVLKNDYISDIYKSKIANSTTSDIRRELTQQINKKIGGGNPFWVSAYSKFTKSIESKFYLLNYLVREGLIDFEFDMDYKRRYYCINS